MVKHMIHDVKFNGVIATLVLTGILTLINFIVMVAVMNLLLFHLWIGFKGITTFEYIMRRRKLTDLKKKQKLNKIFTETQLKIQSLELM